ncbi:MAG: class I tRNA ligase family protein [Paludibacter sp.]|nr:class I tRNA ligase family protein [Paludibacter sp.]
MEYNFGVIEQKWQQIWKKNETYKTDINPQKPKYYVLDMFPYPSGAGLHVGHPLGYIASDIYSRYKRLQGFNVLHPMGYDAYGLPAEQYAIQTGQHPAVTTKINIARYREQLEKIGFCYDWDREIRTCEPDYYKWTQWAFIQMFNHYFDTKLQKAQTIESLIKVFETNGSKGIQATCTEELTFTAEEWDAKTEREQQEILLNYRIAYLADLKVNWCPVLGTVLANDEVSEGVSVRGGHPVEQRVMRQWSLRVSAYAQRLLDGLNTVDWTESLKETQKNWIGRSEGAELKFYPTPALPKWEGESVDLDSQNLENTLASPPLEGTEGRLSSSLEGTEGRFRYYTTNKLDWNLLHDHAKAMHNEPTEPESILWEMLRTKKTGYKFRRQHPVDQFIPDFVCLEKKLIVEVDGDYHLSEEQIELDNARTEILENLGYKIIRFSNKDVKSSPQYVVEKIKSIILNLDVSLISETSNQNAVPPPSGGGQGEVISVFTTRADTIYGVTFMVLAPESDYVKICTTPEQAAEVKEYISATKKRTERERIADRRVTGVFSGSYAINPVSGTEIPIWISDYVLAGYGTGAIMAVPAHDNRDYAFAKHFNLPIIPLIEGCDVSDESLDAKEGIMMNSGFLNGMTVKEAIEAAKIYITEKGIGHVKVNYRLRDAIFSRQRYWGEPFPVYYKDGLPYMLDESRLPLELPEVDKFLPTEKGEPPLGRAKNWNYTPPQIAPKREGDHPTPTLPKGDGDCTFQTLQNVENTLSSPPLEGTEGRFYPLELNTMPGFAGSSAYYLRYMDPKNDKALVSPEANQYWRNVDLYIGGTEHATGHLIYSRFWNKFLYDLGLVCEDEPFKKLINQGMIQGRSNFVYRIKDTNTFVSLHLKNKYETTQIHVDVNIVSNDILDIEKFKNWRPEFENAEFILEYPASTLPKGKENHASTLPKGDGESVDLGSQNVENTLSSPPLEGTEGRYICGWAVEKMSKSMYNVVNPDDIVEKYGADTLRLYEMFLGPLEQSKPWDTNGIDGVHRFLKKLWGLFYKDGNLQVSEAEPTADELKILHKTIKKITFDIENFSYNTSVSAFMICVNELFTIKCNKKTILEPLVILLAPFAPHIAEELYQALGNQNTVCDAQFPVCNETYLVENSVKYPISFNGKVRFILELPADMHREEVEKTAMANDQTIKQLAGATPKKIIVVQGKIVNIVM